MSLSLGVQQDRKKKVMPKIENKNRKPFTIDVKECIMTIL